MANLLDELRAKNSQIDRAESSPESVGGFSLLDELRAKQQKSETKNDIRDSNVSADISSDTARIEQKKPVDSENLYRNVITLDEVDEAFKKVPGAPALAELASGANRTIASVLDFLGLKNINAVLELAGSDKRVPTFSESIAEEKGAFDNSLIGKAAGTAGELIPSAVGIGQALRFGAQALPNIQAGESAVTGVIRQLGSSKVGQDVSGSALSGVGAELGREVGGETGALIGGVAAPIAAAAIPLNAAKKEATKLLSKAAPTVEKIKEVAGGIYRSLDDSGISVPSKSFDGLADDIAKTLKKEGADEILTPKALRVVNRFVEDKGSNKTLTELDTLRKIARSAAESQDRSEARLGQIAIQKIDDYMDNIGGEVIQDKTAGDAYRAARGLWQRARKTEILETAVNNARDQASGFENGIRTQYRQILKRINTGKLKGFTEQEVESIRKTVNGTKAGNIARFLGKFGVLDGITSRSLTTISGAGLAGAATGSGGVAAAVPIIGQVSSALAQRMTLNNAKMAQNIIKAGKNWNSIANIYAKNTPKLQQSASELAELFLANKIPVDSINLKSAKPLISDAALIAAIAKFNDQKEQNQ